MGGSATITLVDAAPETLDACFALAQRCEALWSRFISTSDLTRLNWSGGAPITVDPLTVRLLRAMQAGAEATGGDYDPTLLPDLLAAGYRSSVVDRTRVTELPASATSSHRIGDVTVDGLSVTLPVGTSVDAGGIGKGLAADLVCDFAGAKGAGGVLAEIGGDVVVAGSAPDGEAWRIGVEDPYDTSRCRGVVRLVRGALVTSSRRKRRWTTQWGAQHHLIDPRTHAPAATRVQTVTVIASTGASAEVLTKPGFLRDTPEYLDWLPSQGAAGLVTDDRGATWVSQNWKDYR